MAISKNYDYKAKYVFIGNTEINNMLEKEDIIHLNDCYLAITNTSGNKNGIDLELSIYRDSEKNVVVEKKYYKFIPSVADNSDNFIKQGYEYLKTLDEYKDAVDLLD